MAPLNTIFFQQLSFVKHNFVVGTRPLPRKSLLLHEKWMVPYKRCPVIPNTHGFKLIIILHTSYLHIPSSYKPLLKTPNAKCKTKTWVHFLRLFNPYEVRFKDVEAHPMVVDSFALTWGIASKPSSMQLAIFMYLVLILICCKTR